MIPFSDRSRVDVFSYRGWRPLRGALLIIVGIIAGYLTATNGHPLSPPTTIDCGRW